MKTNLQGMLLAAGLGTRFKPWTDHHPKALAIVKGKSLLQRNVEYLQQYGITNVVVNVHHFGDQIVNAIKNNKGWGSNIIISDETDVVLETGGGLKKAAPLFTAETIVIMNVDILTDLDLSGMIDFHTKHKPVSTLAITGRTTSRYFLFDDEDTLCGWRNVKTGEEKIARQAARYHQKAFSGIHTIKGFDHSGTRFIDVGKPDSVAQAEALFE
jgi:MurNAc alpha-1-phosphate uridylyltransferase